MSTWVWPGLELCSSVYTWGLFPHIAAWLSQLQVHFSLATNYTTVQYIILRNLEAAVKDSKSCGGRPALLSSEYQCFQITTLECMQN